MMTLDEAIEHSLEKSKTLCGECAEEHKQLAVWLTDLKYLMKNGYGKYVNTIMNHRIDLMKVALNGRLSANQNISSDEAAKLATLDVECFINELKLNYPYKNYFKDEK